MNIFYGVCGAGLGHTGRFLALQERMPHCTFHVFSYGIGYDYLDNLGIERLYRIEGMEFEEQADRGVYRTASSCVRFITAGLGKNIKRITEIAATTKPDLTITDWEPSIPRFAKKVNIPCVSIDSQHKFRYMPLKGLSLVHQSYSIGISLLSRWMVPKAEHIVVSTFQSELIPRRQGVTLVPCIAKGLMTRTPVNDGHLLVYVRQEKIAAKILECILDTRPGAPIVCYGVNLKKQFPSVAFKEKDYEHFAQDLLTCHAVFCTAGNQLISESRVLGKPVFTVPVPGQCEQAINSIYVNILRIGYGVSFKEVTPDKVNHFLNTFGDGIPFASNGVHEVKEVINQYLGL